MWQRVSKAFERNLLPFLTHNYNWFGSRFFRSSLLRWMEIAVVVVVAAAAAITNSKTQQTSSMCNNTLTGSDVVLRIGDGDGFADIPSAVCWAQPFKLDFSRMRICHSLQQSTLSNEIMIKLLCTWVTAESISKWLDSGQLVVEVVSSVLDLIIRAFFDRKQVQNRFKLVAISSKFSYQKTGFFP